MSSRQKKKMRDRIASRVMKGKVTPAEGRRALAAAGIPLKGRKGAPAAAKSAAKSAAAPQGAMAGTDVLYKGRKDLTPRQQICLETYYTDSSPAAREAAFQAAYPQGRTQ
jgi:hypothetical protein